MELKANASINVAEVIIQPVRDTEQQSDWVIVAGEGGLPLRRLDPHEVSTVSGTAKRGGACTHHQATPPHYVIITRVGGGAVPRRCLLSRGPSARETVQWVSASRGGGLCWWKKAREPSGTYP